jgi:hypothetical protein
VLEKLIHKCARKSQFLCQGFPVKEEQAGYQTSSHKDFRKIRIVTHKRRQSFKFRWTCDIGWHDTDGTCDIKRLRTYQRWSRNTSQLFRETEFWRFLEPSDSKIWPLVPWNSEPRMIVLARASINSVVKLVSLLVGERFHESQVRERVESGHEYRGTWKQEWLRWQGPAATYPKSVSCKSFLVVDS